MKYCKVLGTTIAQFFFGTGGDVVHSLQSMEISNSNQVDRPDIAIDRVGRHNAQQQSDIGRTWSPNERENMLLNPYQGFQPCLFGLPLMSN